MARTDEPADRRRVVMLPPIRLPAALASDGTHSVPLRWIATRALMLMLLARGEAAVVRDTTYYGTSLHSLFADSASLHNTLIEYPLPVLLLMVPQFLLAGTNLPAFGILFAITMLLVDAGFTYALWRGDGRRRGYATNLWLWFVPCIGPLAFFRFDLVPAVLSGIAILGAARRPATAGALTAFGAALKLWPAIMMPVFLLRRGTARRVLAGFLGTGCLVAIATVALGGVSRALSPLRYQSGRGLQIESVAASPLMFLRAFDPKAWPLRVSRFKSYEIFGPWVHVLLLSTSLLTALGIALLAVLWWRAHRLNAVSLAVLGWLFFATALVVTITNKALSPQYILWLGGPLAGLASHVANREVRRAGLILLIIAILTHLIFPISYGNLTIHSWKSVYAGSLLVTRNALLVYLTYFACSRVWQLTRAPAEPGAQQAPRQPTVPR
jgi:Glycosyltransferase family 87